MNARERKENNHPTILEAVETLSDIAEMEIDRSLIVAAYDPQIMLTSDDKNRAFDWLQEQDAETTVFKIQEIFKVILDYLRDYYKKSYQYMPNQQATEGIKAIMVLVGEAAKKLDRYSHLFQNNKLKSITDLREYQKLQDFYLNRIAKKIDEGMLSKWIMALSERMLEQHRREKPLAAPKMPSKHVFVDLESVKRDAEYELFFIRKEDGSRFFSPRLIRNIKLVCDFGERLKSDETDDPLESIRIWKDLCYAEAARDILKSSTHYIDKFYELVMNRSEGELPVYLSKALMALLLCSNSHNVFHDESLKCCADYFTDFLDALRHCLHSREYQKILAYPNAEDNEQHICQFKLAHALCHALFASIQWDPKISHQIADIIEEANHARSSEHLSAIRDQFHLTDQLIADYAALTHTLKKHANGPLLKVLNVLENEEHLGYDPLFLGNIPNKQFDFETAHNTISVLRIPSPIHQEYIHKATITEEFKGFLRFLRSDQRQWNYLIFNFQDRTSWKEHFRAIALEELQNHPDFSKQLIVVTLPRDTEFYHQDPPYLKESHAKIFMQHFKKHLEDDHCGFFFPESIKDKLFPEFIDLLLNTVHQFFFAGRNVLPLDRRLDFIELVYLFIEMKIIEITQPYALSLISKDGLDQSSTSAILLYAFHKWMMGKELNEQDVDKMNEILYVPTIINRERCIDKSSFDRMIGALREIELVKKELGPKEFLQALRVAFMPLFKETKM